MQKQFTIGVSKLAPNYENWIKKLDGAADIVDFYTLSLTQALDIASRCSGILLSGGSDIHPGRYGRSIDIGYCKNVDERRDLLEEELIEMALHNRIPLLGICRGQQMINVAMRGTLYPDLKSSYKGVLPHSDDSGDVYHEIDVAKDSLLYRITGVLSGQVNSAHHQAIKRIASGFISVANSKDGVIEAIEASESLDHPFLIAVQWHPERMEISNPLSGKIGNVFLEAASGYLKQKRFTG